MCAWTVTRPDQTTEILTGANVSYAPVQAGDYEVTTSSGARERVTLSAGDSLCSFDSPWGPIGITICFDMRFPELYYKLAERGVRLVLSPADFALTSGQAHFELLCRQRATDAQLFTAVCSLSRDDGCIFEAWAHSMICSPWGEVLADAGIDSGIICKELDLSYTDEVRGILPVLRSRRPELYNSL